MKKLKVLVVDDSITIRKIIRINLGKLGISEVFEASNGNDGLKSIRTLCPDIAFIDYNMPGLNGVELTECIRKEPKISALKIIAISSEFDEKVKNQFVNFGVHEFIEKPFDLGKFNDVIRPLVCDDDEKVKLTRDVVERLLSTGTPTITVSDKSMVFDFGKEKLTIDVDIFTSGATYYQEIAPDEKPPEQLESGSS